MKRAYLFLLQKLQSEHEILQEIDASEIMISRQIDDIFKVKDEVKAIQKIIAKHK